MNVIKGIVGLAKFAGGIDKTEFSQRELRLFVCGDCPSLTDDRKCAECGCYVSIKASIRSEKCPLEKW